MLLVLLFSSFNDIFRNRYCVKEVSSTPKELCGYTQYFGDRFHSQCVFKKCASECVEGTYKFTYDGELYTRQVYCCDNKDYCNGKPT